MDFALKLAELTPDTQVQAWVAEQFEIVKTKLADRDAKLAERDAKLAERDTELHALSLKTQALVLELAHLRRMRFGQSSEAINSVHGDLFDETVGSDVAALEAEIDALAAAPSPVASELRVRQARIVAGRQALPAHLPRTVHRHDLDAEHCHCNACGKRLTLIGEDVSEQLDVTPSSFFAATARTKLGASTHSPPVRLQGLRDGERRRRARSGH